MASQPAQMPVSQRAGPSTSDADLLDRVRSGNTAALQRLVDRYWEPLTGFASRILGGDEAAEDVVQRAFIRLWERRERWRPGSAPKPILYTMVRNLALNQLESDRARARRSFHAGVPKPPVETPAQLLEERELARVLDEALSALPPRRREALVLARFHHLSHAEIAEVMGLAKRTVTNHITTALAELEVVLSRYMVE